MSVNTPALDSAIAVTRFGLGARAGEIAEAQRDPQGWLIAQIRPDGADSFAGPSTHDTAEDLRKASQELRASREAIKARFAALPPEREGGAKRPMANAEPMSAMAAPEMAAARPADAAAAARASFVEERRDAYTPLREATQAQIAARAQLAMTTPAAFRERWALFWSNHFTVAGKSQPTRFMAPTFEREAVRPHVFGRFDALLFAASTHPEMLAYLDQQQSIGPNSPAQRRRAGVVRKGSGLNENLAREIMELHTVGAEGGYTQADVTEFARALTGWGVGSGQDEDAAFGEATFRPNRHEPGERVIMGRRYRDGGAEQTRAILQDLARRPQTAQHLCTKLARHFVSDTPDPKLVAKLEAAWSRSDGDLSQIARALVSAPEAWAPAQMKLKTPYELIVSSYRAVGATPSDARRELLAPLNALGHQPFQSPQPNGWPDDASAWAGPGDLVKRLTWSQGFANLHAPTGAPLPLAQETLGARLSPAAAQAISRAETRSEALALLIMSPEFQRR